MDLNAFGGRNTLAFWNEDESMNSFTLCLFVCPLAYWKSCEQTLMKFLDGWGVAQRTIDYILVAIRMTIRSHEFEKKILCEILYLLLRLLVTAKNKTWKSSAVEVWAQLSIEIFLTSIQ